MGELEITSRKNPTFKKLLDIGGGRGVRKHGLALISGPKQVNEILRDFPVRCKGIVLKRDHKIPQKASEIGVSVYRIDTELFQDIDFSGTRQPILLVGVEPFSKWPDKNRDPGCTLFIPFQDPANVGAVIRSAVAFGVSRIVMLKEAAHPFHHKSTRAAGASILKVTLFDGPSIKSLGETNLTIVPLSAEGKDVRFYRFPKRFGLIPGLEGPGLPAKLKRKTSLSIPMDPGVESLNAAVATGIALFVWRSRLNGAF